MVGAPGVAAADQLGQRMKWGSPIFCTVAGNAYKGRDLSRAGIEMPSKRPPDPVNDAIVGISRTQRSAVAAPRKMGLPHFGLDGRRY